MIPLRHTPATLWFTGFFFTVLFMTLLIPNNVLYFITSLLASLFLASLLQGWRDIRKIKLEYLRNQAIANEPQFDLLTLVNTGSRPIFGITLEEHFAGNLNPIRLFIPHLSGHEKMQLKWNHPFQIRGEVSSFGIFAYTQYPLGVIQIAKRISDLSKRLVWPGKKPGARFFKHMDNNEDSRAEMLSSDLRQFQPQDDARQIVWRLSERGSGLISKSQTSGEFPHLLKLHLVDPHGTRYPNPDSFELSVVAISDFLYRQQHLTGTRSSLLIVSREKTYRVAGTKNILDTLSLVQREGPQ